MKYNYNKFSDLVKGTWLKLLPFMASVVLYFVLFPHRFFDNNLLSTTLKCLPIFCLMFFVSTMGMKFTKDFRHHQLIFFALIFSSIGDAFLDYKNGELFELGMAGFAVAQIIYITAFGFKPFRPILGLILYILGAAMVSLMFKNFTDILVIAVPVYCSLLLGMVWRSNARITNWSNLPRAICGISSFFFLFSDAIIAFDKFYTPIANAKYLIMPTYYIAQLGLTLSILDHELGKSKKSSKNFPDVLEEE